MDEPADQAQPDSAQVIVYSRPGCPFCVMLRTGLRLRGVSFREVDIWQDPDAAAFVRSVGRGNETVPTVSVGDVSLVNPSAKQVAALVGVHGDD
jgi:mycoredoxin